jgi:hypothetical protein
MVVVATSLYQIGIILIKEKLCNDNGKTNSIET